MQMKIGAIGAGVGVPRTSLQVSALNIVKFYLRHGLYDPTIIKLDIHDLISVGGKSGTFIFSALQTKWFELDPMKDGWTHNPHKLIGKKAQIEVTGVVAMRGCVDIVFKVFDKYNQGDELVKQCCIEVVGGFQFSNVKVMGIISQSEV